MYKVFRNVLTWSLLAVALASAAVWDLSKWETLKNDTVLAHRAETWNLWFTDVVPKLKKGWDVFVWDWGSQYTKLEHKLADDHELVRFSSFYKPHKWVAVWFHTWWDGKVWDSFHVWENTNNGWVTKEFDVHKWASLVTAKWDLWKDLNVLPGDNFKLGPANWVNLVLAGHANQSLSLAGKWHPNWSWSWQDGAWKFNLKKNLNR